MTAVKIDRIASGGDGVGRTDAGLTVFVPRTAPGDVATVTFVKRQKRYARGVLVGLESRAAMRVEPECRHYREDQCGGCQLQHLTPAGQLEAKQGMVGDALRRIAHRDVHNPSIVASPDPWHYRSKITLAVQGTAIGFHRYDRPGEVFPLDECLIARPSIMRLWHAVRLQRDRLPEDLVSLVMREDRAGGLHLIVRSSGAWDAGPLARAVGDAAVSYWWAPIRGAARVVAGAQPGFPALAFDQASPLLAEQIREAAVHGLGEVAGLAVWDLYGGVGDTALLLAKRGASVWTVDIDRTAAKWARKHGESAHTITRVAARVEESLHRLPPPAAVVVNPPRTGLHAKVATRLDQWAREVRGGARLAYISCDPATLARDLSRLPTFQIHSVTAYDAFPQTSHVETLAILHAS